MERVIEEKISQFVSSQFPSFYQEEGSVFIEFVKAYYEWMEESGNIINLSRNVIPLRDVDDTLEEFLSHFQQKYLYGIPFNVIVNKRLLLKHVLDVYRSKGSLQCYKLLFRLIYNEDMTLYIPGNDILRISDGTWKQKKYLEVTNVETAKTLVGKTIYGIRSKTSAIVESYSQEVINKNIITLLYITNVFPKNGTFIRGERIIDYNDRVYFNQESVYYSSPVIVGSLNTIEVVNGGQNFKLGDILKIVDRDLNTNVPVSYGKNGYARVTGIASTGRGLLSFTVANGGFGFSTSANTFLYNGEGDDTGTDARFSVGSIKNAQQFYYNTDILIPYLSLPLDSEAYGFPGNLTGNLTYSTIGDMLSTDSVIAGTISTLTDVSTGINYTNTALTFVKEIFFSDILDGNVSYSESGNTITGDGTNFTYYFSNNDVISVKADNSIATTEEAFVIKEVVNDSIIEVYGTFNYTSTETAEYKIGIEKLRGVYAPAEINLLEANVYAVPEFGNNVITHLTASESGKGYLDGEFVKLYLSSGISYPIIQDGGTGYSNGDSLVFYGGEPLSYPIGSVETDSNGTIISIDMQFNGSGYISPPEISVKTLTGTGARIVAGIQEYNTTYEVTGIVRKSGIGTSKGYWSTTRGFLNSDKYIQDSYYYQDYSYQINTALTLNKYKNIIYDTFHIAGTALFGKYELNLVESTQIDEISLSSPIITT